MSENEKKRFQPQGGYSMREVDAWRRPPEYPEWSISVSYGDTGWDIDAGTFGENKEKALKDIDQAIEDLGRMKKFIEEEL